MKLGSSTQTHRFKYFTGPGGRCPLVDIIIWGGGGTQFHVSDESCKGDSGIKDYSTNY